MIWWENIKMFCTKEEREKKVVIAKYKPFGEIQSGTICKSILNKLVAVMETEREELIELLCNADLNDKNSISFFGELKTINRILTAVNNLLKNYGVEEE